MANAKAHPKATSRGAFFVRLGKLATLGLWSLQLVPVAPLGVLGRRPRDQTCALEATASGGEGPLIAADADMYATYDELAARVVQRVEERASSDSYWVSLAGFPGSGKTSLSAEVGKRVAAAGVATVVLPMDGFHLYRRELDALADPADAHARRGAPFTFDAPRLLAKLGEVRSGLDDGTAGLAWPSFDHEAGDPVEGDIPVPAETRVVLVEGNYLLLSEPEPWSEVRGFFHETWYLDVDLEVAVERVARRHMQAWGWDYDRARARASASDKANMVLIAAQGREGADLYLDSLG